jgi:hypothetical protein
MGEGGRRALWITADAGQLWLSLEDNKSLIWDFSTARVCVLQARASVGIAAHTLSDLPVYFSSATTTLNKNEDGTTEKRN